MHKKSLNKNPNQIANVFSISRCLPPGNNTPLLIDSTSKKGPFVRQHGSLSAHKRRRENQIHRDEIKESTLLCMFTYHCSDECFGVASDDIIMGFGDFQVDKKRYE